MEKQVIQWKINPCLFTITALTNWLLNNMTDELAKFASSNPELANELVKFAVGKINEDKKVFEETWQAEKNAASKARKEALAAKDMKELARQIKDLKFRTQHKVKTTPRISWPKQSRRACRGSNCK